MPRRQGTRDHPFIVTTLIIVPAVGVGRIQQRDAGIQRRMEDRNRGGLVAIPLSREPHASQGQGPVVGHALSHDVL